MFAKCRSYLFARLALTGYSRRLVANYDSYTFFLLYRSEADSLPTLFVAPQSSAAALDVPDALESLTEDPKPSNVFYFDGVCAARRSVEVPGEIEESSTDAQSLYYALLRRRFLLLRSTLRCSPPLSVVTALDDSHPISIPQSSKAAHFEWRRLLPAVDPQMAQLACMDVGSVLRVLDITGGLMSKIVRDRDAIKIRRISAWIWGLLGRCRDLGELGSEDVAEIRGLGKRAVTILTRLRDSELKLNDIESYEEGQSSDFEDAVAGEEVETNGVTEQLDANEHDHQCEDLDATTDCCDTKESLLTQKDIENTESQQDSESLEEAKTRLRDRLQLRDEKKPLEVDEEAINISRQIRAMLDMVVTVVGEFYSQRDLLNARDIWEEDPVDW